MASWFRNFVLVCLLGVCPGSASVLIGVGDTWRFLPGDIPLAEPEADWTVPGFDDAGWPAGRSGFSTGYGLFEEATSLAGWTGNWTGMRFRREFVMPATNDLGWLVLRVNYADGLLARLNGVEVARRNLPGEAGTTVPVSALATVARDRGIVEEIDLTEFRSLLRPGTNAIAVQVHRLGTNDTSLALTAELLADFPRGPYLQDAASNRVTLVWTTARPADGTLEATLPGGSVRRVADTNLVTRHALTLDGLPPGTEMPYRVTSRGEDGTIVTAGGRCRTLRPSGPVRFLVVGDTGSGRLPQYEVAAAMGREGADFVVHLGDVIYPYFAEGWVDSRCLSVYREQMARVPWFFALGNHDISLGPADYLRTFWLPTNGVPADLHAAAGTSPEHYYSFDHGDVHFVVLFQPYLGQYQLKEGDAQFSWLTNDLARTTQPWRLVFLHHPLQTSSQHRFDDINGNGIQDRTELKDLLLPVAWRFGVQALFTAHDHCFERFVPTNGVHTVVSGGGGMQLYSMLQRDVGSAQWHGRHHFTRVTVEGDELRVEAVDTQGAVFDRMTLRKGEPFSGEFEAAWHTPDWAAGASDGDDNRVGQFFDFQGPSLAVPSGDFSNLGRFHANHDGTNLFLGFSETMLYGDSTLFVFVEGPRSAGVADLSGLGNGLIDPFGEGVEGLDSLTHVAFDGWSPALACLLGDERGDGSYRWMGRPEAAVASGQGVFRLDAGFSTVPGARLQQFNRSPQFGGGAPEVNADFIEVAIPFSALGGLQPGEVVRMAAVAARPEWAGEPGSPVWTLDRGCVGAGLSTASNGIVTLRAMSVRLGPDPDPDRDGLTTDEERTWGTDPARPDTDGDGLRDGWEVQYGFDPMSAPGAGEGLADADADGMSNAAEQAAGTDPRSAGSRLELVAYLIDDRHVLLLWETVPGRSYQVQERDAAQGTFRDLLPEPRVAAGTLEAFEREIAPAAEPPTTRMYRIRLVP